MLTGCAPVNPLILEKFTALKGYESIIPLLKFLFGNLFRKTLFGHFSRASLFGHWSRPLLKFRFVGKFQIGYHRHQFYHAPIWIFFYFFMENQYLGMDIVSMVGESCTSARIYQNS
jgi:hypothetical protein